MTSSSGGSVGESTRDEKTGVLFVQSQEFFGADSQIHASIMRHLDRDRFEVFCALPKPRGGRSSAATESIGNIPDVRLRLTEFGPSLASDTRRERLSRAIPAAWSLLGLALYVRRNKIAVVHCTEKPRDVIAAGVVARLGGAKCVIHVHIKAENWIRPVVRRAMSRAAALIGVSEWVAGSIRDLGYDTTKVFGVLNGLETRTWIDAPTDHDAIRREFEIADTSPILVSASRLFFYKGQHELIAALPSVKLQHPDVKVLIVGEDDPRGHDDKRSYTDQLKEMCAELDLEDTVIFTGFRSDVRSFMAACDVYAMPSFEEPFGMVFIEAMSLGKPVVALNNGGTPEVVDDGGSGLLSAPADTEALAANINRLLGDPALRGAMGAHGRERVVTHLNSERMTREIEDVYEAVLGAHEP